MIFYVNVPVLSLHILLAPPIISHDDRFLTKFYSSFIFPTEYANAIVTAKGNPSGTATTIIVTEIMNDSTNTYKVLRLLNCISPR